MIDTSVIVAILLDEAERERFVAAIDAAPVRLVSAVSLVEATMGVEGRKGASTERVVDRFVEEGEVEIVPVSVAQARLACEAFRAYGKRRHPASLNWATTSPMRSPRRPASRCCSKEMTLAAPPTLRA